MNRVIKAPTTEDLIPSKSHELKLKYIITWTNKDSSLRKIMQEEIR
jgi:hypothetical protein